MPPRVAATGKRTKPTGRDPWAWVVTVTSILLSLVRDLLRLADELEELGPVPALVVPRRAGLALAHRGEGPRPSVRRVPQHQRELRHRRREPEVVTHRDAPCAAG